MEEEEDDDDETRKITAGNNVQLFLKDLVTAVS
jgi:hypothetical protein